MHKRKLRAVCRDVLQRVVTDAMSAQDCTLCFQGHRTRLFRELRLVSRASNAMVERCVFRWMNIITPGPHLDARFQDKIEFVQRFKRLKDLCFVHLADDADARWFQDGEECRIPQGWSQRFPSLCCSVVFCLEDAEPSGSICATVWPERTLTMRFEANNSSHKRC